MQQDIEEQRSWLLLFAFLSFVLRHPFQIGKPSLFVDLTRFLVMKESKVEAEGGDTDSLFIDVQAGDLFPENLSELRTAEPPAVLFAPEMPHHPAKGLHEENPRPTCRIDNAGSCGQHLRRQSLGKHKLDESRGRVMRPLISLLAFALVIELLVNGADQFNGNNIETIGEEE